MDTIMQQQQQQKNQQQGLAAQEYSPYPQRPLSPITEEANAPSSGRKRSRDSPIAVYDSSGDDRDSKRRQTFDSQDYAEANAGSRADFMEVSREGASTRDASPRESIEEESRSIEADGQEGTDDTYYENSSDVQSPLERDSSDSPNYESDSDCYALPKIMRPREPKCAPYRDPSWSAAFKQAGTFMCEFPQGLTAESEGLCRELLEKEQEPPKNSLFDDDVIERTCARLAGKNETSIFRDITPLVAPSVEILATRGEEQLSILCESTNEVWTYSQPLLRLQPQPSYAVGFKAQAFTEEQFRKVTEFFEDKCTTETSPLMGTSYMFFPCFSVEIGPLEIAQRQNTHNMTVGMRAVVDIFRAINREGEVHRQALGFSISHNARQVQIVAHYPVISGEATQFYQQVIHSFDFADPKCMDKWAGYRFTRNLYDVWMPAQFDWIRTAINGLPAEW
ncbi:hypothetical protein TARUN_3484 [Trichoderma arundinaceum]|uniref:DUF7924 domain-containing protein n=1 Tax=Trichoderma arundinaceum TaxID=490622 RepID=A0A395NRZ7_TRIAR|nr:hypothetical protein TARUN_3484 [Trichoderma arundinaceum]